MVSHEEDDGRNHKGHEDHKEGHVAPLSFVPFVSFVVPFFVVQDI